MIKLPSLDYQRIVSNPKNPRLPGLVHQVRKTPGPSSLPDRERERWPRWTLLLLFWYSLRMFLLLNMQFNFLFFRSSQFRTQFSGPEIRFLGEASAKKGNRVPKGRRYRQFRGDPRCVETVSLLCFQLPSRPFADEAPKFKEDRKKLLLLHGERKTVIQVWALAEQI